MLTSLNCDITSKADVEAACVVLSFAAELPHATVDISMSTARTKAVNLLKFFIFILISTLFLHIFYVGQNISDSNS